MNRNRAIGWLLAAAFWAGSSVMSEEVERPENAVAKVTAVRCANNPLITAAASKSLGHNINGPSVIRVPAWIKEPLGTYYMYFGDHGGKFIRLAYANKLEGPWTVYERGTLRLEQCASFANHIASPDVLVDEERQELRMYFHGPAAKRKGQWTGVAVSKDGLSFEPSEEILGKFYFRVWKWDGWYYAIAKNWNEGWGELLRSKDGLTPFESRGNFLSMMRHGAVTRRGDELLVFYSRAKDAPERIVLATVKMGGDWTTWRESEAIDVLTPEAPYEGIEYPVAPSKYGAAIKVRQLRDPCIFEEDGKTYLFYTIAGEMGIAMAELTIEMKPGQ